VKVLHFKELFKNYKKISIPINGIYYKLVVADTAAKKQKGLSQVLNLPKCTGMIFTYNTPVNNAFTMQNTKVPLTIIFLDSEFKIVEHFKCNPFQNKKIKPVKSYSYVIEI
jgi:uncharacterized membrane protein (UPF0127 family)